MTKKNYGTVEGGPDKPPEKPAPPQCPVHKRAGRYAWGQFVVCSKCDEETHGTKTETQPITITLKDAEDTWDEITPVPGTWTFTIKNLVLP